MQKKKKLKKKKNTPQIELIELSLNIVILFLNAFSHLKKKFYFSW